MASRSVSSSSTAKSSSAASICSTAERVPYAPDARESLCSSTRMSSREATAELERMTGREPQLVEAVQILRIGDRDADLPVGAVRVRNRHDALQHVQREELGRLLVDARHLLAVHHADERGQVDVRHLVLQRQHPGDAVAGGDSLRDEGRAERAV